MDIFILDLSFLDLSDLDLSVLDPSMLDLSILNLSILDFKVSFECPEISEKKMEKLFLSLKNILNSTDPEESWKHQIFEMLKEL